jgi:hypothetical protein
MKISPFELIAKKGTKLSKIEASDLSEEQYEVIVNIIRANHMDDPAYIKRSQAHAFLQGEHMNEEESWVLIEFWTDNQEAILSFIDYVNSSLGL